MRLAAAVLALLTVLAAVVFTLMSGGEAPPELGSNNATAAPRGSADPRSATDLSAEPRDSRETLTTPSAKPIDQDQRPAASGATGIVGRVVFDDDGSPVPQVPVTCASVDRAWFMPPLETETDDQGRFRFDELAHASRFEVRSQGASVFVGTDSQERLALELRVARAVRARGIVVDEAGRGIAGATITVSATGDPQSAVRSTRADREGRFELRTASGWVRAHADGFCASAAVLLEPKAGSLAELRLALAADPTRVTGRVVDRAGRGVRGAAVVVSRGRESRWVAGADARPNRLDVGIATRSGEDGVFTVDGLAQGELFVRARAVGIGYGELEVPESTRRSLEVAVGLEPFAALDGTVRAADGSVPEGLSIGLRTSPADLGTEWRQIGVDGRFAIDEACPGSVSAQIWRKGSPIYAATIELPAGEHRTWNLTLPEADGIAGRVVDARGTPLPEYTIIVLREGRWLRSTNSAADGSFAIEGLDPGPLTLRAGRAPRGADARALAANAATLEVVSPDRNVQLVIGDEQLGSASLVGRVLSPAGEALAGATLQLSARGSGAVRIDSDAEGRLLADGVTPGSYHLALRHPEHPQLFLGEREIRARETVELGELRMPESGRLLVRARSADGTPLDTLSLIAHDERGRQLSVLQKEGDGWRSGPLPLGPVMLIVAGANLARSRHELAITGPAPTLVEVTVRRGLTTNFVAALPAGVTTPNWIWISLTDADGRQLGGTDLARGDDGQWRATAWLAPGRYTAWFGGDDARLRGSAEFEASLDGVIVPVTLALQR